MGSNIFRFLGIILLAFCLTGCPGGEDDCYTKDREATENGLVLLSPINAQYTAGETITLNLTVPAANNFFESMPVNLFEETGNNQAEAKLVMLSDKTLFAENHIEYIKGTFKAGELNTFLMNYNTANQQYELEMKIRLDRTGNYEIPNGNAIDIITFKGSASCNRYFLYTNFSGGTDDKISFTVVP